MRRRGRWSRFLPMLALAAWTAGISGCLGLVHRAPCPEPELRESCAQVPGCCRGHVYIFFMNGIDPAGCANLGSVRRYLDELGFHKSYYGQIYHALWFQHEINRIHVEDREARIVLIGFNVSVNAMDCLARQNLKKGIAIDLMVFLSGDKGLGVPQSKPDNVVRVVNIVPETKNAVLSERAYASNIRLCGTGHFGTPTHIATLHRLAEELMFLTAAVPDTEPPIPPAPHYPEEVPTPRPVKARRPNPPDEWDFLIPVAHLGQRPD